MPEFVRSRCQGGSAERGEEGKDSEPGSTWNFFFFFGCIGLNFWFANQNWSKGLCESETEG